MNDCQVLSPEMTYFSQLLEAQAYDDKIPLHGTFELTARCNFNCNMCYVHLQEEQIAKIGRELTNEEWLDIARQARDAGMLYLTLTGGEVFARPGFKELYLELSKMGFLIHILSNGYLIDENIMEWLKECPPYTMRFTLYGSTNDIYENVCGVKNGFDRVSQAIDLIKASGIPFHMVGTIVKENAEDLINMYAFAKEKNVPFQHTIALLKPVRGADAKTEEHRIDLYDFTEEEKKRIKKVKQIYKKSNNLLNLCGSYRKSFWVTWNGNMQLCSFTEKPAISIRKYSFEEAWYKLLDELEKLSNPAKCRDCKYEGFCKKCPGVLSAECGGPDQITDEFCMETKQCYEIYHLDEVQLHEEKIY